MKLKIFTPQNNYKQHDPRISIKGSGVVSLGRTLARIVDIQEDETIALAQDETNPKDWYLVVGKGYCKARVDKQGNCLFNHSAATKALLDSIDCERSSQSFLVSEEPVTNEAGRVYAIITLNPLIKK